MALGQAIKKVSKKLKKIKKKIVDPYGLNDFFDDSGLITDRPESFGVKLTAPASDIKPHKKLQKLSTKNPGKAISVPNYVTKASAPYHLRTKGKVSNNPKNPDKAKSPAGGNQDIPATESSELDKVKGLAGKIQESLTGEKSNFQKTLSERKGNAISEDGKTNKSLEYHLSRVGENAADFAEQTKGVKTMDDVRNLAKDKGIDIAENASDDDIVNAIQGHYSDRAKAEASFGDKMMAHKVPQKALGAGFTLGVVASLFTGDGKKSNADLYSSPY